VTYSYKALSLKRIYEAINTDGDGSMTFYAFRKGEGMVEGRVLTVDEINSILNE
jgi:hypothetical protein